MIDNVSIDDEGTISIDYSHNDSSIWTKKIKWIKLPKYKKSVHS